MNTKTILLIILCIVILLAGIILGRFSVQPQAIFSPTTQTTSSDDAETTQSTQTTSSDSETNMNVPTENVGQEMTEGQRQLMQTFGLNPDEVVITAEMVACAEAKVGVSRMQEIKNGATPSFSEGASLLGCYK